MKNSIRFLVLLLMGLPGLSHAAETDWKRQFAGLDGIVLICIDHSDGNYGKRICDDYLDGLEDELRAEEIPFDTPGYFRHDDEIPEGSEKFQTPLLVKLFIRGTAGNQIAIQMRARASVPYASAIEKGGDGQGRKGELVLWERSTTGSGPAKQLRPAIVEAMGSRSLSFTKAVREHWTKN